MQGDFLKVEYVIARVEEQRTSSHISSCSYQKSCSSMSVDGVSSSVAATWA